MVFIEIYVFNLTLYPKGFSALFFKTVLFSIACNFVAFYFALRIITFSK